MKGLTVQKISLTPELVDRILQTAIDAGHTFGFGYWGQIVKANRNPNTGLLTSVEIVEHDPTPDPDHLIQHTVWIRSLRNGILKALAEDQGKWRGALFDDDALDGPLAELLIQYAMFGEQVYG
jgi:hypothetical protein